MKRIIVLIFLIFMFNNSNACDCDSIIGVKNASIGFKGTVISVRRVDSPFIRYEIVFKIRKKIIGRIRTKRIIVNVPCLLEMCCGIPFKERDTYVIYSYMRNDMLYTGACTKSHKL